MNCDIGPAILEDVTVEDLETNDLLIFWGSLFKHVTLRGDIGQIKINSAAHFVDRSPETQSPFDKARGNYYANLDWAIDIRDARFQEFDMHGVPARLVRRDPVSQVVVTRQKALDQNWRKKLSPSNKHWPFVIDMFLDDNEPDIVLVAPKRKKKYAKLQAELNELRESGVVEQD